MNRILFFLFFCICYSLFSANIVLAQADNPPENCVTSVSINIFATGIEFVVCHLSGIFDTYIAQTPNILSSTSPLASDLTKKFVDPIRHIAIDLLILSLIVETGFFLLRTTIASSSHESIYSVAGGGLLNYLCIILLPAGFSLWIDLNNEICSVLLSSIGGGQTLSSIIASQINLEAVSLFPSFVDTFLWILLLVTLLYILFFFILRFILLWVFFLVMPILISLSMFHYVKGIMDGILVKIIQFTLVQPVFILGVGIFMLIVQDEKDVLTRYILGLGSLMSLAVIPSVFAGIAGGKLFSVSTHYVGEGYDYLTHKISEGLHWIDDRVSAPYEMPIEKPDK